jgi:hypothetical protein
MNLIKGVLLPEKEYYTLKYDGVGISGEVFVSAVLFDISGQIVFELAEYIKKPEWDESGDYTGLVAGLLACANLRLQNIVIVGCSKLEKHEEIGEFFNDLFTNFTNVASILLEERELNTEAVKLTNEVINSKKHFYRQFSH